MVVALLVWSMAISGMPAAFAEATESAQSDNSGILVYDFHKLGLDAAGTTQPGWSIVTAESTPKYRAQPYGLHMNGLVKDDKLTLQFDVPESGKYEVKFKSYLSTGGGKADVFIDGIKLTTYNFYAAAGQYSQAMTLGTQQLNAGTHKITFKATGLRDGWGNDMYPSELQFHPVQFGAEHAFDFRKLGVGTQGTQPGWSIVTGETTPKYREQPYGLHMNGLVKDDKLTLQFDVPESGKYEVKFKSYLSTGGGKADVFIDGIKLSTYNFYAAAGQYSQTVTLGTQQLDAGTHKIMFKATGLRDGWGNDMYPSELLLAEVPSLKAISLSAAKTTLVANETMQLTLAGKLTDRTDADLTGAAVTYTSSNEAVATVDGSGTVTALQPGSTTVDVAVELDGITKEASLELQVAEGVLDRIEAQLDSPIFNGRTETFKVRGFLTGGQAANLIGAAITVTSGDPDVISFDAPGTVTARSLGQTDLRVEVAMAGVTKHVIVPVEVVNNALAEITVAIDKDVLFVTEKANLTIQGKLLDGSAADLSQADIAFSSSDSLIATVDDGTAKITAHAVGAADITVAVTLDGTTLTKTLPVQVVEVTNQKTRATFYTPEKVAAARSNVQNFDWARSMKTSAVSAADKVVQLGYEYLWNMVPPQTLPRSYGVNQVKGSPVSGTQINAFGNYPFLIDPVNEPWKLIDPSAKDANGQYYKYPTNDFGAYYRSGLDENGIFRPELANRALLVNELYPEKGPNWGVDDSTGWVDANGNRYTFIAYYVHWGLWYGEQREGNIQHALNSLKNAYLYTGDAKYARAGTILLDRIADVYPQLDISAYDKNVYLNSHGGTGKGKAIGSIWETTIVKDFVSAYDAFFPAMDDPVITDFLQAKAAAYDLGPRKRTAAGIRRNIEDGIVRQVFPSIRSAQIRGNDGMHQSALAMAAIVYDTLPESKEWLDFNFQAGGLVSTPTLQVTGGNIMASLVGAVDRDGNGNEAAPGYNALWLANYQLVADILLGNDIYPEADLYENVKFQKIYDGIYPLMLSDNYIAQIGDSGQTGNPGLNLLSRESVIRAFEVYGKPVHAQLAYFLNNNHTSGIHSDVFTANPELIANRIGEVIEQYGPLKLDSANLTGYGFAALRDGVHPLDVFGITYAFPTLTVAGEHTPYKLFTNTGTLQLEATAPGGFISFEFDAPKTDQYEIALLPLKAASYGIYRILIDGVFVKDFDFYGSGSEKETIAVMPLAAGKHTIRFEGVGKREIATNYKMGLRELSLLDSKAVADREAAAGKSNTLRDVWMYYGRSSSHGHRDTLNLGLHAFGLDLAPDLGYPEFADSNDMHRHQWVNNTVSHNTVVVDKSKQAAQWVGTPKHFDDSGIVQLVDVEAPGVYSQTSLYKRTTAMIQVDEENSYAVDFFRVKGGTDHHFSFHGPEGSASVEGLELVTQPTGTYAGPNVAYGERVDSVSGAGYTGSGFHYLKNVRKDETPSGQFSVDWDAVDTYKVLKEPADIHLRLTMLAGANDVALADGVPPTNKPNNPQSLTYLLAHRTGTNLESHFASVIEPYKGQRFVAGISPAVVKANGVPVTNELEVKAVKVELTNGRTDYIVSAMNPEITYTIDDRIEFSGFFGMYAEKDGRQVYGYVNDGSHIAPIGASPERSPGRVTGTVTDFTKTLSLANHIDVQMELSGIQMEELAGKWLYIVNDGIRNASYEIKGVSALGDGKYRLDIGDMSPVRSYANSGNLSQGFVYDFAEDASFVIPLPSEAFLLHTEATVTGNVYNGWYKGDATVQLSVYGGLSSSVTTTTYSLDGGQSWNAYTAPLVLQESGEHTLSFRSADAAGRMEPVQSIVVRVDNVPPAFTLLAGGEALLNGTIVEDSRLVVLTLQATDGLSGIASQGMTVDGQVYEEGMSLNWAGQLGTHTIGIWVEDHAGNRVQGTVTIQVTTSPASVTQLIDAYEAAGELGHAIASQLRNNMMQAVHHWEAGRKAQALKSLDDFMKHMDNTAHQSQLSAQAKAALAADIGALRQMWE
ncbi:FIMAH domain-containing protein [Paenibacillus sp. MBLB4367]|uniref:FIMAH domain-containing protein n=1 Tax=Paenibacillus sp. MBLB4367 TaxID=3384767 RepID=UPI00390820A0